MTRYIYRALRPQYGFRLCPTTRDCAVSLRSCRRDRSAAGRRAPSLAGDEHVSQRVSGCLWHTSRSSAGRGGHHVSGIQIEIEKYENATAPRGKAYGPMTALLERTGRSWVVLLFLRSTWLPYVAAPRISAPNGVWSDSW